jgi:hypothetical protein
MFSSLTSDVMVLYEDALTCRAIHGMCVYGCMQCKVHWLFMCEYL